MPEKPAPLAAVLLMLVHDVMLGSWGLLLLILPERVLTVSAEPYVGLTWDAIVQSTGREAQLVINYMRFWGLEGLLMALVITLVTVFPYRKGALWAWITLLICGSVGWLGAVALDIQLGLLSITYIDIVPLLLCWVSLAVSAKAVFSSRRAHPVSAAL